ncbi:MAG TPA: TetR/AcrR family transcriptional regulator [Thermodesulfatator atlanticus]|uniref:TetR/AcrR family transcriptional regulator n=1 Tax=Thermodesulfatator atlanticus TaxID=501497 RepID=A0A7V5U261_9BACT|nr:TetR/AcrR family transcriptional regulator [Thermodesulfatator atlanticus]
MPKKSRDKEEKILQAAIKVFAQKGFFNARISEIAKEAGVADGTIYLYFRSKYDLLVAIFEREFSRIVQRMKEELATLPDARAKLERYALLHLRLVEENRYLAELFQIELRQSYKFMKDRHFRKFAEYVNLISRIVREGQAEGLFRKDVKPGIFKRAFFGALDEMSRFWILSPRKKYRINTAAKQIASFFLEGILKKETANCS